MILKSTYKDCGHIEVEEVPYEGIDLCVLKQGLCPKCFEKWGEVYANEKSKGLPLLTGNQEHIGQAMKIRVDMINATKAIIEHVMHDENIDELEEFYSQLTKEEMYFFIEKEAPAEYIERFKKECGMYYDYSALLKLVKSISSAEWFINNKSAMSKFSPLEIIEQAKVQGVVC